MSLRELAATDGRAILEDDGDVAVLTSPSGATYSAAAQVIRCGVDFDANGLPVPTDKTVVTISLVELASLGLDPDTLKAGAWRVATTDSTGAAISGLVQQPLLDRTLGRVTFTIKRDS